MRISDWSSDVCSSDLLGTGEAVAAGDSYSQFLRTATRLMNEVGYRGTSIDRIAAELNLTKGSFYHHLPTKDELILQCFRNSYQRLRDLREQARKAGLDAWETLISVIAQAMKYQFGEAYGSEERSVGKECVSTCRYCGSQK